MDKIAAFYVPNIFYNTNPHIGKKVDFRVAMLLTITKYRRLSIGRILSIYMYVCVFVSVCYVAKPTIKLRRISILINIVYFLLII